jgi:L-iditol 2-dehydrogenase
VILATKTGTTETTQRAALLLGPKDIRLGQAPIPSALTDTDALIRVTQVGICGSDLHTYIDGRIGDTIPEGPFVLGHEFAGVVEKVGKDARDGARRPLEPGQRVAVDPSQPCGGCESCLAGHPNLCPPHRFCGVWPTPGALQERLIVPADTCFPVPDSIDDDQAVMLESMGVGLHAIDLAHIRVGHGVAIIGSGTIGLCCAQVACLAGASRLFVTDRLPHRLAIAERYNATTFNIDNCDPVAAVMKATGGRGVDVAIEAAWSDASSVNQAVDMLRPGGRLVIVGISGDDQLNFQHSSVRRKGLTIAMCRRMKHTYPRAIDLVSSGQYAFDGLVTHRYPLDQVADAFASAADYGSGAVKVMVKV